MIDLLILLLLSIVPGLALLWVFKRAGGVRGHWPQLLIVMALGGALTYAVAAPAEALIESFVGANLLLILCFVAPMVEEPTKLIAPIFAKYWHKITRANNMAVYGSASGAGFGVVENMGYVFVSYFAFGFEIAFLVLLIRSFLTMPFHACSATITSFGLARGKLTFVVTVAIAMLAHGLLNYLAVMWLTTMQTMTVIFLVAAVFLLLSYLKLNARVSIKPFLLGTY